MFFLRLHTSFFIKIDVATLIATFYMSCPAIVRRAELGTQRAAAIKMNIVVVVVVVFFVR